MPRPLQVAPAIVQHLLRGYLAGWGTYLAGAADYLGEESGALPTMAAPADLPIVSRFMRSEPQPSNRLMTDFYDLKNEITSIGASIKIAEGRHEQGMAQGLRARHLEYSPALQTQMNDVGRQLSQIRGIYQRTEMDANMSAEQKTAARDLYYRRRDQILDRAKPLLRQAEGLAPAA
jgi:hypothetical protein